MLYNVISPVLSTYNRAGVCTRTRTCIDCVRVQVFVSVCEMRCVRFRVYVHSLGCEYNTVCDEVTLRGFAKGLYCMVGPLASRITQYGTQARINTGKVKYGELYKSKTG